MENTEQRFFTLLVTDSNIVLKIGVHKDVLQFLKIMYMVKLWKE